MNRCSVLLMLVCVLFCNLSNAQTQKQTLSEGWEFSQEGIDKWYPAIIPGSVQWNLIELDRIPHPFIAANEDSIKWIEDNNWIFRTKFHFNKTRKKSKRVMVFNGLDTYAEVYLNEQLILEADNMFRKWEVDVSDLLENENELRIIFQSPKSYHDENEISEIKTLPHDGVPERPLTRKAAYQFGWDWGPRVVTMGIWRPIEIVSYKKDYIDYYVSVDTKNITNSKVDFEVRIIQNDHSSEGKKMAKVFLNNALIKEKEVTLIETVISLQTENYNLWQPNNWGKAHLHDLRIEIYRGKKLIDLWENKIGFRTVELVNEEDSIGTSFYFKINGEPIFCKGANYIPMSPFPGSHTDDEYRQLLISAAQANINMLRVWGGGVYEKDIFYDLCDSLGIMVWQDFMFANTMFDISLTSQMESEVKDNVIRLATHPCIVHWCGNNEIAVAWENWGWQKQYEISELDSIMLNFQYKAMFKMILPSILNRIIPSATYSHTSPLSNWGRPENFNHSSMHYWGVFHGEDPFTGYGKNIGRFTSEYGFQTFPSWNSLQYILPKEQRNLDSELLAHRQKSYKGNRLIFQHLERHYPKTKDLKEFSYLSQLTQAKGMSYAIQNHRINKPHSMGSLYWQLNDVWPAISWSSIEYNGERRALYYTVKEGFNDPAIFIDTLDNKLDAVVVNDRSTTRHGTLVYMLMDATGKPYEARTDQLSLKANSLSRKSLDKVSPLLDELDLSETFLLVKYGHSTNTEVKIHSFLPPKDLKLREPKITVKVNITEGKAFIGLTSDVLALKVQLQSPINGTFNKNYIDLLPNEEKWIEFTSNNSLNDFKESLEITTLNDIIIKYTQ